MNSLGIFCDVNLKKSNDLMDVFEQALSKTNNLMETMENFNSYKIQNKNNINDEQEKNNNINNEIKGRKLTRIKTFNQKKANKFQLKPIKNNNKYYKVREPYNYQKEYEKDLINQIESLFNPNYKKSPKESAGMLSFISPLIDSNIINKNKDIYGSKERINKAKSNSNFKKVSFKRKSNEYNIKNSNEGEYKRTIEKKLKDEKSLKINKDLIPDIKRPINKSKTSAIKEIYFKSNKNNNNSNVDLLINKLKKKYF